MKPNNHAASTRLNRPRLSGRTAIRLLTAFALLLALCLPFAGARAQEGQPTNVKKSPPAPAGKVPPLKKLPAVPKQNTALYLGWRGRVDTQLDFSEFFHGDHTIMCWFMPQYPHGYEGPLFAENGGGIYAVGQGDYSWGDGAYKSGKNGDGGSPVLFIQVGDARVIYLATAFKANQWHHLAVVRQNGVFKLYLDGVRQKPVKVFIEDKLIKPDSEIKVTRASASLPSGKLRLGRRGDGTSESKRDWQAYGLLDDVAVFRTALSESQIGAIIDQKRLNGQEQDLLAGWGFDKPGDAPLPPLLASPRQDGPRTYKVPVSANRDAAADSAAFNNALIIGETQVALKLPFHAGEVWRVVQGYDSRGGTHNGYGAFSYDLKLYKDPDTYGEYPAGTAYAPLLAAAPGKAVAYIKDGPLNSNGLENNRVFLKIADGEYLNYEHLAANSSPDVVKGGTCDAKEYCVIPDAQAPNFQQGSPVGKVGPKAYHLHLSGRNLPKVKGGVTIPVAFSDYWASDDLGKNWVHVLRGHPKAGQLIKREPVAACEGIVNQIKALEKARENLYLSDLLKNAPPNQKADIAQQIKEDAAEIQAKIWAKEKELELCLRK